MYLDVINLLYCLFLLLLYPANADTVALIMINDEQSLNAISESNKFILYDDRNLKFFYSLFIISLHELKLVICLIIDSYAQSVKPNINRISGSIQISNKLMK